MVKAALSNTPFFADSPSLAKLVQSLEKNIALGAFAGTLCTAGSSYIRGICRYPWLIKPTDI